MAAFICPPSPCTLEMGSVRLEPLSLSHAPGLQAAAREGQLWQLRVTSVPEPQASLQYIEAALQGQRDGHMCAFAVREIGRAHV